MTSQTVFSPNDGYGGHLWRQGLDHGVLDTPWIGRGAHTETSGIH